MRSEHFINLRSLSILNLLLVTILGAHSLSSGALSKDLVVEDELIVERVDFVSEHGTTNCAVTVKVRDTSHRVLHVLERDGQVVTRSYFLNGRLHAVESDSTGDGLMDTLGLHGEAIDEFYIFMRGDDGFLFPAHARTLEARHALAVRLKELDPRHHEEEANHPDQAQQPAVGGDTD